ncbi:uncharacterized protein LOC117297616 [Asterias rubens]|uniref:uncharacterized protein LOC117297616 n=1 Tax=Asterias rubens TaxID=7604 RepID=UPI0014557154|nr:uncharacterized protein LOC117297616 [Asterias rubens]
MGIADHCAVLGCNNDRRYPERYVIKDYVKTLKFHTCRNKKNYALWTKLLKRPDFTVKESTKVCSNHFKNGQPFPIDPHPVLFMNGYDTPDETPKSTPPVKEKRALNLPSPRPPKRIRTLPYVFIYKSVGTQANPEEIDALDDGHKTLENDHSYVHPPSPSNKPASQEYVAYLEDELARLSDTCDKLRQSLYKAKIDLERRETAQAKEAMASVVSALGAPLKVTI